MTGEMRLDLIVLDFPHLEHAIIARYQESSNFMEICEDYVLCLESIHRVESMKEQGCQKDLSSLQEALSDLREELISKIER